MHELTRTFNFAKQNKNVPADYEFSGYTLLKTQLQPPLLPICPENYIIPKGYN
jgi:hypothetical protein